MSSLAGSSRRSIETELRQIAGLQDSAIDLAAAALALAALERPDTPRDRYLHHLSLLVRDTADLFDETKSKPVLESRAEALRKVIVERYGYDGDRDSYDDLENANLMRVIDRRRGLPVTLGILYLHCARGQDWRADGLNFPGHFLIRLEHEGDRLILDPFDGGKIRSAADLRTILKQVAGADAEIQPSHTATVGNRAILLRVQNNIKARLLRNQRREDALGALEAMLMIAPGQAPLWYEAGLLNAELDNLRAAIISLQQAIDLGTDHTMLQECRAVLGQLKSRLN